MTGASPVGARPRAPGRARGPGAVLGAVLGAGTLLVPMALAPMPAPWAGPLLTVALAGWCVLVARAGGTLERGPTEFVRARLGERAARLAVGLYYGGFALGQAAVALTVGALAVRAAAGLGFADPVDPEGAALSPALVVLVAATAWAARPGRGLTPRLRRVRLVAVVVVAVLWWLLGRPMAGPGSAGWSGPALMVPLLFAWVGLEAAVPAWSRADGPDEPPEPPAAPPVGRFAGRAGPITATVLGTLLAGAVFTVLLGPVPFRWTVPGPVLALPAGVGAVACAVYCWTNLRATGARWTELTGRPARGGVLLAGTLAGGALVLGHLAHWGTPVLLLGPGAATAALLLLIGVAAARRPVPPPSSPSASGSASFEENPSHDHDPDRPDRRLQGAAGAAG
ncbi:hypothetical protein ACN20G_11410 [Streptomyces sp. BI20]|uniref:hypothetical protein n=1 Tax=Streptomyces sp. BI20 TaxID=3403460 RepID=UPI003C781706